MSKDAWKAAATTDALFPDDLEEEGPLCVVGPPIDAENVETDAVQFGTVAELDGDHHDAQYLVTPQRLKALIASAWREEEERAVFEVTHAEKGPKDHDPWEIEGRVIENGDAL